MSSFKSVNAFKGEELKTYSSWSMHQIETQIKSSSQSFENWKIRPVYERAACLSKCAEVLLDEKERLARLISLEMGKPIREATAEIEKCASVCKYYAEHAEGFLKDIKLEKEGAFVTHQPLGVIFAVMPWNYPFWQVFRCAAPIVAAGNVLLLKHAPSVPQCAEAIQELFLKSGFPEHCLCNMFVEIQQIEEVVKNKAVKAITLTGSERAGSAVASLAGKYLKKSVLELGGSDPFIVLPDADLERVLSSALKSRFQNNGQSCIAAKRFFIHSNVYEEFKKRFTKKVLSLKTGNPLEAVDIGPLARPDLVDELEKQVNNSVAMGARVIAGGKRGKIPSIYLPTLLEEVRPGMPAFDSELFGPVAALIKVDSLEEAIALSNRSDYGLAASVWTNSEEAMLTAQSTIESGAVFINEVVHSDPRLPFGGIKNSGFGRELSMEGMMEFVNVKTIVRN